ncbi:LCP family protein [Halobacillus kuroshimensis]|uniref:LCP family protein n=1 Tax=Halobacillus kuroshimensis TaxID=302481 RepID=UPI000405C804|nr:LCP family protein [Halobacillus kuroshimensis]
MSNSRSLRKRRNKRRRRKGIIALFAFILLAFSSYTAYEFLAGKHRSLNNQTASAENAFSETTESLYKDEFKGVDNGDDQMMVLLLGIDQRGSEVSRTDTMMLAQYDKKTQSTKIVSLMRDMYVDIPGHGKNKLNAAFAIGGPELLRETIAENFGVEAEYYSIIDFNGFTEIVDTLSPDGVEIDVEKDMQYTSGDGSTNIDLKQGNQTLSGDELLGYVRFRSDASGDFGRVDRQQKVIQILKDELLSVQGVLKAPRLVGSIQPYIDTNLSGTSILNAGKDILFQSSGSIDMMSVPTNDNVWNERKDYPVGLVLNHDFVETAQTLEQFFEEEKESDVS